ncbi:1-deoxy-D-xylulose-5-phosphate reductoisomerase [Biformimicrobium ophioploci]|uniref:1-deoxy-D-xylulose 5-phosphate reductoisomerase n=1 Tax=Biformimicrobium ophioploci TaxID=3036711 RepID=A0ABQ6LZK7_9GAMM|nr:1-deoxy-D-xylulose-5-phosphate reductoisomerase [Microbulbifer sp. NKW57]GMG87510.1 1-deoxy-D-xylulose-5-phosphate reductoisomerase [Microbulbifer sp. NKW57]
MQAVTVLGATGSIGVSTLDVLARHPDRYSVYALTANSRIEQLFNQCLEYRPVYAVMPDESLAADLQGRLEAAGSGTRVLAGVEGLQQVSSAEAVDVVMAAIVGAAGLRPTLAAVRAGKRVLLANKEALVMAGPLFMRAVVDAGAELLPIDSEHNAIFQCLPERYQGLEAGGVRKILLTGSGGPFRELPLEQFAEVTPDQACAHPNWDMGRKISVDSATMMNKGLEFIEACFLFDAKPEQIEVVLHPQSIVHSMVQYVDGSLLAQMGNPDMRTPIAHALAFPERIEAGVASLDLVAAGQLDFEAPCEQRFPCLRLAREAMLEGGTAPALLNAANEVAVASFLEGELRFSNIPVVIESVLEALPVAELDCLETVEEADGQARVAAAGVIQRLV